MSARPVQMKSKVDGSVLHGVQDTDSGVVYPFPEHMVREIAGEVNAGREQLKHFGLTVGQQLYEIEDLPDAVQSEEEGA